MNEIIDAIQEFFWIIIPLVVLQLTIMGLGIWQWTKKKHLLGSNSTIWLVIIIVVNLFGSLIFLYYTKDFHVNQENSDEWEA